MGITFFKKVLSKDKGIINKQFLLIIAISLLVVTYIDAVSLIGVDTGDYKQIKSFISNSDDFIPTNNILYLDDKNNLRYSVQVIEFNDDQFNSEYLDIWITPKTDRSKGTINYGDNTIFIDEKNLGAFWRSGPVYVKMVTMLKSTSIQDPIAREDVGELPQELIMRYLEQYPSDCNTHHCRIFDEVREERRTEELAKLEKLNKEIAEKRKSMLPSVNFTKFINLSRSEPKTRNRTIPDEIIGDDKNQSVNTSMNGSYINKEILIPLEPQEEKEDFVSAITNFVKDMMKELGLIFE